MRPIRGSLAYCSIGDLGVILSDKPEEVVYPNGDKGMAWTGKTIWPLDKCGNSWSSKYPSVVGYLDGDGIVLACPR